MALTKLNNQAVANITTLPVALGDMVLVSSATASSSASIEFSLGSYKEYQFYFVNIHPATDNSEFQFNMSTDSGSNYNVTKTSTFFQAYNDETGAIYGTEYSTDHDLAQSTAFQDLGRDTGNDADQIICGSLSLFNPSSTTYVKHYIANTSDYIGADYNRNSFIAGYANTTSALTNIKFQFDSGNIDAGTILMYGIN